MVVETYLDPSMEICQNTPGGYRVNTVAGGGIPHQITLISPSFSYGRHGTNNSTIVKFETMVITSNTSTYDESQPKYTW